MTISLPILPAPILVVEDEPLTSMLIVDGLEEAGFAVVTAWDAEQAIALLAVSRFCAVVTDVNFAPNKLTGWDIARCARQFVGNVPVLYISGASGHEWAANGVSDSLLLRKPFTVKQIVATTMQLLDSVA